MPCRDSGLPHDTRNIMGTSQNVFYTARTLRTFSCVWHTCMAQAQDCSAHVFSLTHPSLLLLFFDGHFKTFPDLADISVHAILPNFSDLRAQVRRTPHEDEEFGYLAKFLPPTGYEPKKFGKFTSVDDGTTLINYPDHNISDLSKTHEREHWPIRCSHSVWILCFARFSFVIMFVREKAKKACNRETVARQREKKEKVLWSVLQSRCQREVNGRGHLERRAQQAILGEKLSSEKMKLDWARHGDQQIGTSSNSTSSNCLSRNNPANGPNFVQEIPLDLRCLPGFWAILCHGRRIHTSLHPDRNFEQSGSVRQFYSNVSWYCVDWLSVTIW